MTKRQQMQASACGQREKKEGGREGRKEGEKEGYFRLLQIFHQDA